MTDRHDPMTDADIEAYKAIVDNHGFGVTLDSYNSEQYPGICQMVVIISPVPAALEYILFKLLSETAVKFMLDNKMMPEMINDPIRYSQDTSTGEVTVTMPDGVEKKLH